MQMDNKDGKTKASGLPASVGFSKLTGRPMRRLTRKSDLQLEGRRSWTAEERPAELGSVSDMQGSGLKDGGGSDLK